MRTNACVVNLSKDETFGAPCTNPHYHGVWRPHEGHQTRPRYFPPVQTNRRTTHTEDTCSAERQKPARKQPETEPELRTALFWAGRSLVAIRWFISSSANQCAAVGRRIKKLKTVSKYDKTFPCHFQDFYVLFTKLWRKCSQGRWSSREWDIIITGDNSVQSFSGIPEGKLLLSRPACM